jgi:4,5-dihydroxyphthalate decarboxylase
MVIDASPSSMPLRPSRSKKKELRTILGETSFNELGEGQAGNFMNKNSSLLYITSPIFQNCNYTSFKSRSVLRMTSRLPLTFACGPYDRVDAIAKGEVQPAGIDLNYIPIDHPRDIFDRMLGGLEFDASEMSSSEYISRYADGEKDLLAIPVFPSRAFRHNCIAVNTNLVLKPLDLNGKRIGVQRYTMTAAVWIRGALQDAGVDLSSITWVEGDFEGPGAHSKVKAKPLLRPVDLVQNQSEKSLSSCLEDGDIAATIGAGVPSCLGKVPHVQHLFPDLRETTKQYFLQTGIFPIMHLVVIRKAVTDKHPFVATSLFNALNESKNLALRRMKFAGTNRYMLPFMPSDLEDIDQMFGGDPWPYGVEANRKPLEALVSYLYEQGMIARRIPLEELFAPVHGQNLKI